MDFYPLMCLLVWVEEKSQDTNGESKCGENPHPHLKNALGTKWQALWWPSMSE